MAKIGNLVHQTSTSTGTGNITVSTVTARRSFNTEWGTGGTDVFYYFILHQTADEWEFGTGHLSNSTTLVRDTVLGSSNANSLVNFSAGNKDVINDIPASLQAQLETTVANSSLARIGASTYFSVQHLMNFSLSSGVSSGGEITVSGTADAIDVAAGTGFIKAVDSNVATLRFFDWDASPALSVPSNSVRFIGVEYNSGSPQVVARTTNNWNLDTEFPLGIVVNEAGTRYITDIPWITSDTLANVIERFDSLSIISRDNRIGGLILSNTGTRNVLVTAGTILGRMSEFDISTIDTSASGSFDAYYRDGGSGWTKQSAQTQWNNSQYDDNSGSLATLTASFYSSRWFYIMTDGTLAMVYGQNDDATLSDALNDGTPSNIPDRILEGGILIGRFIIQAGAGTPTTTQSAFGIQFTATSITNINDLGGVTTPGKGGTGIANNNLSTLTISGAYPTTLNLTGPTNITLPTSGTLSVVGHTHVTADITNFNTSFDTRFDTNFTAKSTTNLTEGTNLYYTQARFDTAFSAKSTTNLAEGTNLYYTTARFNTDFGGRTTTNLTEGTNLYYTQARFDTAFSAKSTTNLAEGTNLYYTDERVDDRVNALIQDAGGIRKSYNDAGNTLTLNTAFATQLFHVVDQKTQNTDGGTFTAGAWRTRDLNTTRTNEITGASLAANQITLPAGTYYCEWAAPAWDNDVGQSHQTRLQNITGAATLLIGESARCGGLSEIMTHSRGDGRFTLAGSTVIELQHQNTNTQTTTGFGFAADITTEVYSSIRIWKVA